jgi:hypothetical protein
MRPTALRFLGRGLLFLVIFGVAIRATAEPIRLFETATIVEPPPIVGALGLNDIQFELFHNGWVSRRLGVDRIEPARTPYVCRRRRRRRSDPGTGDSRATRHRSRRHDVPREAPHVVPVGHEPFANDTSALIESKKANQRCGGFARRSCRRAAQPPKAE